MGFDKPAKLELSVRFGNGVRCDVQVGCNAANAGQFLARCQFTGSNGEMSLLDQLLEDRSGGALTEMLMLGATFPDIRLVGIGFIAGILIGLVILLYFVIWRAARNSGEELNAYIVRNFRYARLLSYLSDLLLKFTAVALVMLAGHPEWVPPLLLAFTGDYLVQGRLFTLPTRLAVLLGTLCIAAGLYQFLAQIPTLLTPLAVFTLVALISMTRLIRLHRGQVDAAV